MRGTRAAGLSVGWVAVAISSIAHAAQGCCGQRMLVVHAQRRVTAVSAQAPVTPSRRTAIEVELLLWVGYAVTLSVSRPRIFKGLIG